MITVFQVLSDTNIGGAGRYLLNYIRHFDRTRFNVTVMLPEHSKLKPLIEPYEGVRVVEVPYMEDASYDKRCVKALVKMFRDEKPAIVHTHASLSARIAAKIANVPTIIATRHCIEPVVRGPVSAVKSVLNNFLCDYYIAVSDAVADNLKDSGIRRKKIKTIYNGVEAVEALPQDTLCDIKRKFGIEDETVFGIFARLEDVKGHRYFIEAAKRFLKAGGKGKFLIVGDGTLKESLMLQAENTPEIIFTGYVEDTKELLNITDVNVLASSSEAMSLAILEAMSLNKPTVATNVGGNPQLIQHDKNGLLTTYADVDGMAAAFLKIAEDKAFYKQCAAAAGASYRQQFTAEIMTKNLEKLYEEV